HPHKRNAVAWPSIAARGGHRFDPVHHHILGTTDRPERRRLRFYYQHVAVRQHVERARVLQGSRYRFDLQSLCDGWCSAVFPPDHRGDVDRRKQILLRLRQVRICANLRVGIKGLLTAPCKTHSGHQESEHPWTPRHPGENFHTATTPTRWR